MEICWQSGVANKSRKLLATWQGPIAHLSTALAQPPAPLADEPDKLALGLSGSVSTSRSISEALALGTLECAGGPLLIVHAKGNAVRVAVVKLGEIAVQMLF